MVNVHPLKQDTIPWDRDGVVNRNNDITFSDRTEREEQVLLLVSDYVDLARELIKIAKDHGAKDDVINALLDRKTMNHGLAFRPRKYSDIIIGQYEIGKIIRINRKNDEYTISNKIFDFSSKTINQLRESGYNNTLDLTDVEYKGSISNYNQIGLTSSGRGTLEPGWCWEKCIKILVIQIVA